ncbi:ADP-dependent glucokinase/phosphofructokinase [Methanolobus sediminis]|uniref:ADP-dependent glucokinase/phosphofructokinase n=1 Tax=Methanolobus sediminis TaxID=3072978 RepID=A0AA51UM40_9EURY|nr:ADP-dependent glucokinase/phosphofructokinase [Methanolobus sediminis]WMW25834.1 ADP-dependent glucokinase/phosphofructokinase [Methanolobus sediminis]
MNILCAYNANIDSIYHIDGSELSCMIGKLESEDSAFSDSLQKKLISLPGSISSKSDFLAGLITCMHAGSGAEWMISDSSVFEWIKKTFIDGSFMRMGGNMGIMSNVLSELGASRVVPNVASLSKLQLSFFSTNAIYHPFEGKLYKSSELVNLLPENNNNPELIHFVFDFRKGDVVSFSGQDFTVPRENRFIATYDPLNFELHMDEEFRNYSLKHVSEMDGAIISGYHMLHENKKSSSQDDSGNSSSSCKEKLDNSLKQLQSWKNIRKDLHIHVEFGHFSSNDIALYAFSKLSPIVDRIGMNEDELAMLAGLSGINPGPILEMNSVAIADAAISLCSDSGLCRMLIHTREFVVSVSCMKNDDPEIIIEAMNFGAGCAAAFACSGKLADRNKLLEIASDIPESEFGKKECSRLAQHIEDKWKCSTVCGSHDSYQVTIVPTRICDEPVSTVGLGDTISAAIFLRELELNS